MVERARSNCRRAALRATPASKRPQEAQMRGFSMFCAAALVAVAFAAPAAAAGYAGGGGGSAGVGGGGRFRTRTTATARWVRTVRPASATGRKGSRPRPIRATRTLSASRRPPACSPEWSGANRAAIGGSVTSATIDLAAGRSSRLNRPATMSTATRTTAAVRPAAGSIARSTTAPAISSARRESTSAKASSAACRRRDQSCAIQPYRSRRSATSIRGRRSRHDTPTRA